MKSYRTDSSKQKSDGQQNCKQLNISIGSAYSVVHDSLQFLEVCARWVPKELTDEHTRMCLDICSCHLDSYHAGDNFLQWTVTGDKTWVHQYQQEIKWNSMQWKAPSSLWQRNSGQPLAGTLMFTIFWDSQGHIPTWTFLQTYLECGTTVTRAAYCDMLKRGLKSATCSKRRGRLSDGVLLLHDNARPHTLETLRKLKL
jgi:hypothetical protein